MALVQKKSTLRCDHFGFEIHKRNCQLYFLVLSILAIFCFAPSLSFATSELEQISEQNSELRASSSTRILVYGDAGDGSKLQQVVGEAMWQHHQKSPFQFAVSMGDNQYLESQPDLWKKIFEIPYAKLISAGVPFYQTLGNHDLEKNRLAEQLAYSRSTNALALGKGGFVLPSENYVIEKPNLRWIVLNISAADSSISFSNATEKFLRTELCVPSDGWKVLSMHYPFWSTGPRGDNLELQAKLLPILEKCPVDFILTGHEHQAEVFLPYKGMQFAIVGNAHEIRPGRNSSARESLWFYGGVGFAELNLQNDVARFALLNDSNQEVFAYSLQRRTEFWADSWRVQGTKAWGRMKPPAWANTSQIEAQVGFSKTPSDPLLDLSPYEFFPAFLAEGSNAPDLLSFNAEIPTKFISGGVAVFRYRARPTDRWVYGDLSDGPGLHGNYDGISMSKLLVIGQK